MYYVCQIQDSLLGAMSEHKDLEDAIMEVKRIISENGIEITSDVEEEINEEWSYLDTSREWSVCIGKVG